MICGIIAPIRGTCFLAECREGCAFRFSRFSRFLCGAEVFSAASDPFRTDYWGAPSFFDFDDLYLGGQGGAAGAQTAQRRSDGA